MTSTTSLNKKMFARLFKWAFARNRSIMTAFSIIMALGIIIDIYILTRLTDGQTPYDVVSNNLAGIGFASIVLAQFGTMLFTLISASHTFSFLHNKRTTDMYGALPATRTQMYFSHLLGGLCAVLLPYTAGSLIVMAITCRSGESFAADIGLLLFGIIAAAAAYSFTALISYCCGTGIDSTITTFGINAVYIGVVAIFWGLGNTMIPGFPFEGIMSTPILVLFAPYGFFYFYDVYQSSGQTGAMCITIAWTFIFTAAMVALGVLAAKKRRAETAQNEFNVRWLPVVVKVGMSILCGGFSGALAASVSDYSFSNMYTFTFWYIVIGAAAFFIFHIIYSRGFKGKLLPSLIAYLCTTAAVIGLVFAMTTGLGIDTYVPDTSNISSAYIGLTNDYSGFVYKDEENIKAITDIQKIITKNVVKQYDHPYYINSSRKSFYEYTEGYLDNLRENYPLCRSIFMYSVEFRYEKKLGITTIRNYYNLDEILSAADKEDLDKIEELLRQIYSSDEFKKRYIEPLYAEDGVKRNGALPVSAILTYLEAEKSTYSEDSSYYMTPRGEKHLSTSEEFLTGLYSALKSDISADNDFYKTLFDDSANNGDKMMILYIYYNDGVADSYQVFNGIRLANLNDNNSNFIVTIPETYTNTINYLKSNDIPTEYIEII